MNWLDLVIIAIFAAGAFMGFKTGIFGAAFAAVGGILGWLLAGQLADDLGELIGRSVSGDRWVTVISYVIIIAVAIVVANLVGKLARPMLNAATLGLAGMVDRLGGLALGLILGVVISGAIIVAMARFAYNFEIPEEGIAGSIANRIPRVEETKERVEAALSGSAIVPIFIDVTDALPGGAFGFVPYDFKVSLDILEQRID